MKSPVDEKDLYRALKSKPGSIMSQDIDFIDGKIFVGGFRHVGDYVVNDPKNN